MYYLLCKCNMYSNNLSSEKYNYQSHKMLDHIQPILLLLEYPIINTVSICIMYAHTYFSSFFVPNAEKLELCKRIISQSYTHVINYSHFSVWVI